VKLVLLALVVFNLGFLVGAWWGSGWGRRQRDALSDELARLRGDVARETGTGPGRKDDQVRRAP
jgi:hypothetical protein